MIGTERFFRPYLFLAATTNLTMRISLLLCQYKRALLGCVGKMRYVLPPFCLQNFPIVGICWMLFSAAATFARIVSAACSSTLSPSQRHCLTKRRKARFPQLILSIHFGEHFFQPFFGRWFIGFVIGNGLFNIESTVGRWFANHIVFSG